MQVVMERPYCSSFKVFTINGIVADEEDFGESRDTRPELAPEYGCGDRRFISDEEPQDGVLERYSITYEEWDTICQKLESKLDWGRCGECA